LEIKQNSPQIFVACGEFCYVIDVWNLLLFYTFLANVQAAFRPVSRPRRSQAALNIFCRGCEVEV